MICQFNQKREKEMLKQFFIVQLTLIVALFFLTACEAEKKTGEEKKEFHWSYEGSHGPSHWGDHFSDCKGTKQSPINISRVKAGNAKALTTNYRTSSLNITNNGHTIKLNYDSGSSFKADGKSYKLLQFHFHSTSENTVNGKSYPMEMHLVHSDSEGNLAVLGVFFEAGAENSELAKIWAHLPTKKAKDKTINGVRINAMGLLPASLDHWHWDGSLTTPPCTEGVKWYMLSDSLKVSQKQIDAFTAIYSDNNRPIQDLNRRTIRGLSKDSHSGHGKDEWHWTYKGDHGPSYWGDHFPDCKGTSQSPIDIKNVKAGNAKVLETKYQDSSLNIVNNGHTIKLNYDKGSTFAADGKTYNLLQFHFHSTSENTVDGKSYPMEMHLVHSDSEGKLAVLGVFFKAGTKNTELAKIWAHLPAAKGNAKTIEGVKINATQILPGSLEHWHWDGSLTTPPCTEGVKWYMLAGLLEVSQSQIDAFTALYSGNNRPVQNLNSRTVRGN